MLYELLTGRLPFRGLSTMDLLLAHATDPPPALSAEDAWVPPAIEEVVLACLAKRPEDRPASAWEVAQRYEKALLGEVQPPSEHPPAPPAARPDVPAPPVPDPTDPSMVVFQMQAWMPETVATYKLRGFIHDAGGEVVESVPGKIRVRLGGRSAYGGRSRLGWLGLGGGQPIEMELQLFQGEGERQNNLWITVILRSLSRSVDRTWRLRCDQIYRDLRGYLIGSTMHVPRS
jgi:serine/threonine-protein kinase